MIRNLSKDTLITQVNAATVSGAGAVNTASVDMAGWEGCIFVCKVATADAGNSMKVAQSANDSSFADLTGSSVTVGTAGDVAELDVAKPGDRYLRAEFDRSGLATALGEVWAIQYGARKKPTTPAVTTDVALTVAVAEV